MYAIAIDLGGTIIKIGLLKESRLVAIKSIDAASADGLANNFPTIENEIILLTKEENVPAETLAVWSRKLQHGNFRS